MSADSPRVLILTPVKDATDSLDDYFAGLRRLTYPRDRLSLGMLESDSVDGTFDELKRRLGEQQGAASTELGLASTGLWKIDYGYRMIPGVPRWDGAQQPQRRSILARSRNQLLSRALQDEDWVLWLDVDVVEYPEDVLELLLAANKDIVQPHCVHQYGGPTFDRNAWRDRGRLRMEDLRSEGDLVPIHAVGGTMLLVRADLHREGLVFPPFPYGRKNPLMRRDNGCHGWVNPLRALTGHYSGEYETEGLGMMAHDMGFQCWAMPNLEIRHKQ